MSKPRSVYFTVHGDHDALGTVRIGWNPNRPAHMARCDLCRMEIYEDWIPEFGEATVWLRRHLEDIHGQSIRGVFLDAPSGPGPEADLTGYALMSMEAAWAMPLTQIDVVGWFGQPPEEGPS